MKLFRWPAWLLALLPVIACAQAADRPAPAAAHAPRELPKIARPTIFIAGDGTAAASGADGQVGWGAAFGGFLDPDRVNFANHAHAGCGIREFIRRGYWARLLDEMKPEDLVLIQFGSEEPATAETGDGESAYEHDLQRMIVDVRLHHASPILVSPTVRNVWKDGRVERDLGEFRRRERVIGEASAVPLVDLTRIVADEYQRFGPDEVAKLFAGDRVRTNAAGAAFNATRVLAGLKGLRPPPLKENYLSARGQAVPIDAIGWLRLPEPAEPALPTLMLVGDSTVRNGIGDGWGGQWGWGDRLGVFFDTAKINLVNRAIGGLSSRTYLTQGHWQRALNLLKPGDIVVVQFGTNDDFPLNDRRRARGTIKGVGEETEAIDNILTGEHEIVHSYGWYLRQYIRDAKAAGVTPIVCSPVPRKIWQDGRIAGWRDTYDGWAREVAQQEGVAFLDLDRVIAQRYNQLGPDKVDALFADPDTHTTRAGAELNASVVAADLRSLPGAPLARYFVSGREPISLPGAP